MLPLALVLVKKEAFLSYLCPVLDHSCPSPVWLSAY